MMGKLHLRYPVKLQSICHGCLRKPIFQNANLSVSTKRAVYRSVVMLFPFYGAEIWTIKSPTVRRLKSFIIGVEVYQQWRDRITSKQLVSAFGMEEPLEDMLMPHEGRKTTKKATVWRVGKERPCHSNWNWRQVVWSCTE